MCTHLEAVGRGEVPRLVINIPPGHMKSLLVSVFFPAWMWTHRPSWRSLFSSYGHDLAVRDSVRCRTIIESDQYRQWYPHVCLSDDENRKDSFNNTLGGARRCTSVGGSVIGWRGDAVVCDDPINATDVRSVPTREAVIEWWDKAMSSRLNDMRKGVRVIIMQRLHEQDLTGHVLKQGGYEHLCLPSEFEPERRSVTLRGSWTDPRTKAGEILFPEMFPPGVLARARIDLGSDGFAGQHQQRPFPADGGMLKSTWWRYWKTAPKCEVVIQSWDMAFKGTQTSDYVVGQVWGRNGANYYLLDQIRGRYDAPATIKAVRDLTARWPNTLIKLVEDAANGTAVVALLKSEIEGLLAVKPDGGKESRAAAISPLIEAGNVYLPDPEQHPWVKDFTAECTAFPKSVNDDQVDAMSQGLNRLRKMGATVTVLKPSRNPRNDQL